MLKLSMDTKDMLEYRKVLQQKCDKAFKSSGPLDQKYLRLQKQLDIMDMVFDTIFVSTMNEVAPQFAVLTGGDFDIPSLKLAIGEFSSVGLTDDTQVKIDFKADAEEVKSTATEAPVIVPEASNPAGDTADYVEELRKLLSRNLAKNIEPAIELYLKGTGKNILPADAWTEIKDMLPDNKLIPQWDIHIATQYRLDGPIAAFIAIKKWLPTWDAVEIGRIAEDTIKRILKDTVRNTPTAITQLRMQMEIPPTKDQKDVWSHNQQFQEAIKEFLYAEHRMNIGEVIKKAAGKKAAEKAALIATAEKEIVLKEAKRLIACMTPSIRTGMERSYGRKPYVEKGYPEA